MHAASLPRVSKAAGGSACRTRSPPRPALALRPAVVFNAYYGDVHSRAAEAYTVYDMLHELTAPPDHPFIAQKRRCLYRAAALFPISYHLANDLVRFYPDLDRFNIHPIPLDVDASFFAVAEMNQDQVEEALFPLRRASHPVQELHAPARCLWPGQPGA